MAEIAGWTIQAPQNGRFGIFLSEDQTQAIVKNEAQDLAWLAAQGNNLVVHAESASLIINHETKAVFVQPSVRR